MNTTTSQRSRLPLLLAALSALAACLAPVPPASAQHLTIRFFNVGQGDAALVTSPEGKSMLVDAGPERDQVDRFLHRLHIDTLDLIVASHNHADHITGIPAVLQSGTVVRFYLDNGVPTTTQVYARVLRAVQRSRVTYLNPTARTIHLGSVVVRVIPPMPGVETQNNTSVGLLVTYGAFTAFFAGDAESLERDYWLRTDHLSHVTLLKVAHHGSSNGTDARWLAALSPCVAVISVGAHNRYGHPSAKTLRLLGAARVTTFRTDRDGTVEVEADRSGHVTIHTRTPARTARPGCHVAQN